MNRSLYAKIVLAMMSVSSMPTGTGKQPRKIKMKNRDEAITLTYSKPTFTEDSRQYPNVFSKKQRKSNKRR